MPKATTPTDPLHSLEAEKGTIGCILIDANVAFPELESAGVTAADFVDLPMRRAFQILQDIYRQGRPVDLHTAVMAFKREPVESGIALVDAEALHNDAISVHAIPEFIEELKERTERRNIVRSSESAKDDAMDLTVPVPAILRTLRATYENVTSGTANNLPAIRSAQDLIANPPPVPPEVIQGVLRQGHKMVLAGTSKSCKTYSLMDLGLCIGHGVEWLGIPTRRGRVLYVDFELGESALQTRIQKIAEEKGINIQPGTMDFWSLRGYAADATTLLPELGRRLAGKGYTTVFIDPVYKLAAGRDENSAGQMGEIMNALEQLAKKSGAAIIFAHHYAKGDSSVKSAIDRMSGSGAFARDPDAIVTLTPHTVEDSYVVDTTLRHFKRLEPFVISWKWPLMERSADLDPAQLKTAKGNASKYSEKDLLDELPVTGITTSAWKNAVHVACGMSSGSFYNLMKSLKQSGKVHHREGKIHLLKPSLQSTPKHSNLSN